MYLISTALAVFTRQKRTANEAQDGEEGKKYLRRENDPSWAAGYLSKIHDSVTAWNRTEKNGGDTDRLEKDRVIRTLHKFMTPKCNGINRNGRREMKGLQIMTIQMKAGQQAERRLKPSDWRLKKNNDSHRLLEALSAGWEGCLAFQFPAFATTT